MENEPLFLKDKIIQGTDIEIIFYKDYPHIYRLLFFGRRTPHGRFSHPFEIRHLPLAVPEYIVQCYYIQTILSCFLGRL
jgi:hypothetical protein